MPVRKYRDVSEMEDVPRRRPGSAELLGAIRELWAFSEHLIRPHFPPGVYRHRSIEDAEKLRQVWEKANVRALRERRRAARDVRPGSPPA